MKFCGPYGKAIRRMAPKRTKIATREINIASAAGDRCSPNICCLWTFSPFDNFEFDTIPLL